MNLITLMQMNVDLCNALGIDPRRVMSLQVSLNPDSMPVVTVKLKVDPKELGAFGEVIKQYKLMPINDVQEVTSLGSVAKEFRATN